MANREKTVLNLVKTVIGELAFWNEGEYNCLFRLGRKEVQCFVREDGTECNIVDVDTGLVLPRLSEEVEWRMAEMYEIINE